MITIPISFTVDSGTAPFDFRFFDDSGQSCVTFSPSEGTTTRGNIVSTVASFPSQECLDNATIKVTVVDANGLCEKTQIVPIGNPCADFQDFSVIVGPNFYFCAQTPLGQSFEYTWTWDPTVFEPVGPTDQICIRFNRINPSANATTVYVTAENENGCQVTKEVIHTFCKPITISRIVSLSCNEEGTQYTSNSFNLSAEPCPNCPIDWTSIYFYNVPPGITVETINPTFPTFRLTGVRTLPVGTYQFSYVVNDLCGTQSVPGTVTVVITETCGSSLPFIIDDVTLQLDCEAELEVGDIFYIDVEPLITPSGNVDWSSFEFNPCGCQTTTSSRGCDITWNPVTRQVEYEICSLSGSDYFEWTICDLDGRCGTASSFINIVLDCTSPPIAANDTACANCGEPITIDVLSNDDANGGIINPASVMITQSATHGTLFINPNGTIVYTPGAGYSGSDTFKYKVANTSGQFSNEATVTITVLCAGTPASVTVCA